MDEEIKLLLRAGDCRSCKEWEATGGTTEDTEASEAAG